MVELLGWINNDFTNSGFGSHIVDDTLQFPGRPGKGTKQIVLMGDSWTQMAGAEIDIDAWLDCPNDWVSDNIAFSGTETAEWSNKNPKRPTWVQDQLGTLKKSAIKTVWLSIGGNDLQFAASLDPRLNGTRATNEANVDAWFSDLTNNIEETISEVEKQIGSNSITIVATGYAMPIKLPLKLRLLAKRLLNNSQWRAKYGSSERATVAVVTKKLNQAIERATEKFSNVIFVDLTYYFGASGNGPSDRKYFWDGFHLNGKGSKRLLRHPTINAQLCGGKSKQSHTSATDYSWWDNIHNLSKGFFNGLFFPTLKDLWNGFVQADLESDKIRIVLKNKKGRCLDNPRPTYWHSKVQVWDCHTAKAIGWVYDKKSGYIRNQKGLCLDAPFRNSNGYQLQIYPCTTWWTNANQQFDILKNGDHWLLKSRYGKCVDNSRDENGGRVHMWDCDTSNINQQWEVLDYYRQPYNTLDVVMQEQHQQASCATFELQSGMKCWDYGNRYLKTSEKCKGTQCTKSDDRNTCCKPARTSCLKPGACCALGTTCYGCPAGDEFQWAWHCGTSRRCKTRGSGCKKRPGDCVVWGSDSYGCPFGNEHVLPAVCSSSRRCKYAPSVETEAEQALMLESEADEAVMADPELIPTIVGIFAVVGLFAILYYLVQGCKGEHYSTIPEPIEQEI